MYPLLVNVSLKLLTLFLSEKLNSERGRLCLDAEFNVLYKRTLVRQVCVGIHVHVIDGLVLN